MEDYTEYSLHRLHKALAKAEKEEDDHDDTTPEAGQEETHKQQRIVIRQKIKDIDKEIKRREKEEAGVKAAPVTQDQPRVASTGGGAINNGQLTLQGRLVENAISELKTFGSGSEVSTFVRDIKNMAHLATCDQTKQYMLNRLFTRLSPEYQTRYVAHVQTNPIKTIDGFLAYIKDTYASCKSIFQHLELLDSFEMAKDEVTFRDYASRLENEVFEIETVIDAKFATLAKKKDNSATGVLGKADMYKLFTGVVFLRTLRKDRELYNHVISKIDDCVSASEIANIADAFKERKQSDDPLFSNVVPAVNHVNKGGKKNKNRQSNTPCFLKFENRCKKGDDCPFSHKKATLEEVNERGYQKWKTRIAASKAATENKTKEENAPAPGAAYLHGVSGFHY